MIPNQLFRWVCVAACGSCLALASGTESVPIENAQVLLIDEASVSARDAGVVNEVLVRAGDMVEQGQVLVRMDDQLMAVQRDAAELEARVAELESQNDIDLRYARKSEDVSRAELERMLQANRTYARSVSQSELAQTKLVAERSELAAEQAARDLETKNVTVDLRRKQVELWEHRLEMTRIAAPMAGMVVEVIPHVGEWLQTGEPAVRMVRLDRLRIKGFVDGHQFDRSLTGARATFKTSVPPRGENVEFVGKIVFVSPRVIPNSNQLEFWADIDNPDFRLRPGAQGRLEISID